MELFKNHGGISLDFATQQRVDQVRNKRELMAVVLVALWDERLSPRFSHYPGMPFEELTQRISEKDISVLSDAIESLADRGDVKTNTDRGEIRYVFLTGQGKFVCEEVILPDTFLSDVEKEKFRTQIRALSQRLEDLSSTVGIELEVIRDAHVQLKAATDLLNTHRPRKHLLRDLIGDVGIKIAAEAVVICAKGALVP